MTMYNIYIYKHRTLQYWQTWKILLLSPHLRLLPTSADAHDIPREFAAALGCLAHGAESKFQDAQRNHSKLSLPSFRRMNGFHPSKKKTVPLSLHVTKPSIAMNKRPDNWCSGKSKILNHS